MNGERLNRWVKGSQGVRRIEEFMIYTVQLLGRVDLQLIEKDKILPLQPPVTREDAINQSMELKDTFALSYLWVLGGYELIRTISQRCQKKPEIMGEELNERILKLKRKFARLRTPLAKMEPANEYKETDAHIAYPELHKELGASWIISKNTHISRRELSDNLLSLLEDISARFESK